MIYQQIKDKTARNEKQLALLIDPDKFTDDKAQQLAVIFERLQPDLLLVGGSMVSTSTHEFITFLRQWVNAPITLYPGSSLQFATNADAMLFISLLSGRNPEFLISHHVAVAPLIKKAGIEAIPTGYLLIDGGTITSVQYVSQSTPIPSTKNDLAVATALAGEYLGMQLIYMDAGSGAQNPVPEAMIKAVKSQISIPLMIGGGLTDEKKVKAALDAGADIVVIGNALEKDLHLLETFHDLIKNR